MKEDKLRNIIKELPHKHKDEWVLNPQELADFIRDNLIFKDLSCNPGRFELAKAIHSKMKEEVK